LRTTEEHLAVITVSRSPRDATNVRGRGDEGVARRDDDRDDDLDAPSQS
jgi:hypothetical protein